MTESELRLELWWKVKKWEKQAEELEDLPGAESMAMETCAAELAALLNKFADTSGAEPCVEEKGTEDGELDDETAEEYIALQAAALDIGRERLLIVERALELAGDRLRGFSIFAHMSAKDVGETFIAEAEAEAGRQVR